MLGLQTMLQCGSVYRSLYCGASMMKLGKIHLNSCHAVRYISDIVLIKMCVRHIHINAMYNQL